MAEPTHHPERIHLEAPAKINLVLTVEGRAQDGFHHIHTVFQSVELCDELIVQPHSEKECLIHCDDPNVPIGPNNLIHRAWTLLATEAPERFGGVKVELIKRIPMGAGLAGGSTDATAALMGIARLFGLPIPMERLLQLSARLGSDCAFFVQGGSALGTGRGQYLTPLASRLPAMPLVLVWPGFTSSTAEAYRRLTPAQWSGGDAARQMAEAVEAGRVDQVMRRTQNVFERVVIPCHKRYTETKHRMCGEGLIRPMLSGTGSAMFGWARDGAHARQARKALESEFPFVVATRLRSRGVRVQPTH